LFYLSAEGKMMAVKVKTGASFEADSPVALFQTHRRQPVSAQDFFSYDVSGDGQRFLIATRVDEANAAPLRSSKLGLRNGEVIEAGTAPSVGVYSDRLEEGPQSSPSLLSQISAFPPLISIPELRSSNP